MADKKNTKYVPSLRKRYKDTVVMGMMEQFSYKNVMEVPKVSHISINMGIGDAKDNPKKLESAVQELTLISCQKPVVTKSRKDISNFKIIHDIFVNKSLYTIFDESGQLHKKDLVTLIPFESKIMIKI